MRQFIIKQMNTRTMNADGTKRTDISTFKRRAIAVSGYTALRVHDIINIVVISPIMIVVILGIKILEAFRDVYDATVGTIKGTIDTNVRDYEGVRNLWTGNYGKGKLVVKNPSAKPTRIPG